ncbi:hypothetical protein FGO68_gene8892 [Halteria grandinella]|uniref:Uncharacterized protein n=1 Tax=Halteria grandinella TaxID=5974 RepID=A0A8J8SW57_HALGN|nr:hypothetical protein FGO68_gene8892 [Halteria grandinella]
MTLVLYENLGYSPISIRWAKTSNWQSIASSISFSDNGTQIIVGSQYYYCDLSFKYFRFNVTSTTQSIQWGRSIRSDFYSLCMKLLDSQKHMVVLYKDSQYNYLYISLVSTESAEPNFMHTLGRDAYYDQKAYSVGNVIVLGICDWGPAIIIYRIQVDEEIQRFIPIEGWETNTIQWTKIIDIYFEQSDTNSVSLLLFYSNYACLGRLYINNQTLVLWTQVYYGFEKGKLINKEWYLFGQSFSQI